MHEPLARASLCSQVHSHWATATACCLNLLRELSTSLRDDFKCAPLTQPAPAQFHLRLFRFPQLCSLLVHPCSLHLQIAPDAALLSCPAAWPSQAVVPLSMQPSCLCGPALFFVLGCDNPLGKCCLLAEPLSCLAHIVSH